MLHEALAQHLDRVEQAILRHLSDDVIGCDKPDIEHIVQEAMEAQQ
jgi:hypothetical protein